MHFWPVLHVVLTALTSFNSILSALTSVGVLLLIIRYHRHTKSVPILLAAYTSMAILFISILLANIALSSLFGFLNIRLPHHGNTVWCRWCTYLFRSALCALFDSYVLQAIFRTFRVILYQKKYLHSFSLYVSLLPCSMIFSLLTVSPLLVRGDISYLSEAYYCDVSVSNLPMFGYFVTRLYFIPLSFIFIIYIFLLRYVHRINRLTVAGRTARYRLKDNNRDLIILKRILITLLVLTFFGIPGLCVLAYFYITGRLFALVYHLTWTCVSLGTFVLCYLLVMFTKPLRDTAKSLVQHLPCRNRDAQLLSRQPRQEQGQTCIWYHWTKQIRAFQDRLESESTYSMKGHEWQWAWFFDVMACVCTCWLVIESIV